MLFTIVSYALPWSISFCVLIYYKQLCHTPTPSPAFPVRLSIPPPFPRQAQLPSVWHSSGRAWEHRWWVWRIWNPHGQNSGCPTGQTLRHQDSSSPHLLQEWQPSYLWRSVPFRSFSLCLYSLHSHSYVLLPLEVPSFCKGLSLITEGWFFSPVSFRMVWQTIDIYFIFIIVLYISFF